MLKKKDTIDLAVVESIEATEKCLQYDFLPPSPFPDDLVSNYFASTKKLLQGLGTWKLAQVNCVNSKETSTQLDNIKIEEVKIQEMIMPHRKVVLMMLGLMD